MQEPQQHEQCRGERADLAVGRQQPDGECRGAHQDQCGDQDTLAPELVAEMAHEEGADRPRHVTHPERRQRSDGRDGLVALGEEDARKHQGGRSAVDDES